MVKRQEGTGPARSEATVPRFPETTPTTYPGSDYSFTLQAVMELQKTVGQLTQAVNTLTEQQKEQAKKLDAISHKIYAAIAVMLAIGAVLTFFAKSINDLIVHRIEAPQVQQQTGPQQANPYKPNQ